MPFNGSGTYVPPSLPGSFNPAVVGQSGTPNDWNTLLADISNALSTTICNDGQTTIATDIPFAGHKITGLGLGTTTGDSATFQQLGQTVSTETGAVASGTTQIPGDDTIPQNTEGDQYMSLSITPKSATSTLVIDVVWLGTANAAVSAVAALFQDSTADALASGWGFFPSSAAPEGITFRHVMTSGTTSVTTFKVRVGPTTAGTLTFNGSGAARLLGGTLASSIVIREVYG